MGWTKVPNDLLERLARLDVNQRGFRILLFVMRRTLGFHRSIVALSAAYIAAGTAIAKSHVPTAIRDLVFAGHLDKLLGGGRDKNSYRLGKSFGLEWPASDSGSHQVSATSIYRDGATTSHQTGATTSTVSVVTPSRMM